MSKFLTPPVWYDSNGNLVEILTGNIASYGATGTERVKGSMAVGKNAYAGESHSVAVGNGATIYDSNAIAIGPRTISNGNGDIVIGYQAKTVSGSGNCENIAIGEISSVNGNGSIAIGKSSSVKGNGSIAIGSGITLGTAESPLNYTIQIGSSDKTYSAQIGDGNGILKCICSKAQTTSFTNEDWIICQKTTENPSPRAIITDIEATYQIVVFYENTTRSSCSAIVCAGGAIGDFAQVIRFSTKTVDSDETSFYVQNAYTVLISSVPEQEGKWSMQVHNREAKNTYTNMGFKYRKIK